MKQNPCPVVSDVVERAHIGFDKLDGTIEAFCTGVTDSVVAVVERPFFTAPGDPAVALCAGHSQFFDRAITEFELKNTCLMTISTDASSKPLRPPRVGRPKKAPPS